MEREEQARLGIGSESNMLAVQTWGPAWDPQRPGKSQALQLPVIPDWGVEEGDPRVSGARQPRWNSENPASKTTVERTEKTELWPQGTAYIHERLRSRERRGSRLPYEMRSGTSMSRGDDPSLSIPRHLTVTPLVPLGVTSLGKWQMWDRTTTDNSPLPNPDVAVQSYLIVSLKTGLGGNNIKPLGTVPFF